MSRFLAVVATVVVALATLALAPATAAQAKPRDRASSAAGGHRSAAPRPCRSGLVALTFDDGPSRRITPRLVELLRSKRVPATFFMVGSRVAAAPRTARLVGRSGFTVANHTWDHAQLTRLSDAGVRREIRSTRRQMRRVGLRPSNLMRPPYGAADNRVRRIIASMGLVPVLWTIDPRDWAGGDGAAIADRVLGALRPHGPNLVLLHDGVGNSAQTLAAVPAIIRGARVRGYCFAKLDERGRVAAPVPVLRAEVQAGAERKRGTRPVRVRLRLNRPTSRPVRVRLHTTRRGTATPDVDYRSRDVTVVFKAGQTRRDVVIRVRNDRLVEQREWFGIRLGRARGLTVHRHALRGWIDSEDKPSATPTAPPPSGAPTTPATPATRAAQQAPPTQPGQLEQPRLPERSGQPAPTWTPRPWTTGMITPARTPGASAPW